MAENRLGLDTNTMHLGVVGLQIDGSFIAFSVGNTVIVLMILTMWLPDPTVGQHVVLA